MSGFHQSHTCFVYRGIYLPPIKHLRTASVSSTEIVYEDCNFENPELYCLLREKSHMTKAITLRKLADIIGVAHSTVQRALSGHPNVRTELRTRIIQMAGELGYSLPSKHRTGNVAIIISCMDFGGYLSNLLHNLYLELRNKGFSPYILTDADINSLNEFMFDGIISASWIPGLEKNFPQCHAVPMVVVNSMDNHLENIYMVSSDEAGGIALGMRHLYQRGCRKVALLLTSDPNNLCIEERLEAYQRFCIKYDLPYEDAVFNFSSRDAALENTIRQIQKIKADAVFCATEGNMAALLFMLRKHRVKVPKNLSVIGMEDDSISRYLEPAPTTIRQNFEDIARKSVLMLKNRIAGIPVNSNVCVPYQLIKRDTVR